MKQKHRSNPIVLVWAVIALAAAIGLPIFGFNGVVGLFVRFMLYGCVLSTMGLPFVLVWMIFFRKDKLAERRRRGLCLKCGYDLCASVDRCPECGTAFGTRL